MIYLRGLPRESRAGARYGSASTALLGGRAIYEATAAIFSFLMKLLTRNALERSHEGTFAFQGITAELNSEYKTIRLDENCTESTGQ